MKKLLISLMFACGFVAAVVAGEEAVTVTASVEGTNNSALRKECEAKGKKNAVRKYLERFGNPKITEKVISDGVASYAKFVENVETVTDEYEDGGLTCTYEVEIKEPDILQWLGANYGITVNESLEIFVMEEPPDAGQIQLGDDASSFFFTRYNMFQRRIRDALVKKVNAFGIDVALLEDNEIYADMRKRDPVLVGVSYDVNGDTKGFKVTPNFLEAVQSNNPDAIALYYRIDALAFDPATGAIRTTLALNLKNLTSSKTVAVGTRDFQMKSSNKKVDMLMADFGVCVERAMNALLNGEGAGQKVKNLIRTIGKQAEAPKGPMKLVINCSQVDKKIKIKVRNGIKKALVAEGLTKQTKVIKESLSCEVPRTKDYGDLDDVWGKVSDIISELLGDDCDISDEWAAKSGDGSTLTVTIGK